MCHTLQTLQTNILGTEATGMKTNVDMRLACKCCVRCVQTLFASLADVACSFLAAGVVSCAE